jgi:hypothetical protein
MSAIRMPLKKRSLTAHQKQIRFFVVLFCVLIALATGGLFWLLNSAGRPGL